MLPRLDHRDDRIGFFWTDPDGRPLRLVDVVALPGAEPERWLPTHLEALDDVLIEVAGRFGEVIGGGRGLRPDEREPASAAYRAVDRACVEYADALVPTRARPDLRAGQILGTASLMGVRLRHALDLTGPEPFEGHLDRPGSGLVSGRAGLHWVDEATRWRGARWLVVTDDGLRLPAALSMLLFDSSGVDKDSALTEHRDALREVTTAVTGPGVEPMAASGALDWLLFDWVMAHRDGPDSGAVQIPAGRLDDARMIVLATAASARLRSRYDPGLLDLPAVTHG